MQEAAATGRNHEEKQEERKERRSGRRPGPEVAHGKFYFPL
jgi:hypothetical protein